jgi:hypothetical protein
VCYSAHKAAWELDNKTLTNSPVCYSARKACWPGAFQPVLPQGSVPVSPHKCPQLHICWRHWCFPLRPQVWNHSWKILQMLLGNFHNLATMYKYLCVIPQQLYIVWNYLQQNTIDWLTCLSWPRLCPDQYWRYMHPSQWQISPVNIRNHWET